MTRETKIGLLVGLAFILVVGILLSEHITGSNDRPAAPLADAGHGVRTGVSAPGAAADEPSHAAEPQAPVPTPADLTPKPAVTHVAVVAPQNNDAGNTTIVVTPPTPQPVQPAQPQTVVTPGPVAVIPAPTNLTAPTVIKAPTDPFANGNDPIAKVAKQMGEVVVPVNSKSTPAPITKLVDNNNTTNTTGAREYKAQAGDTLSRLASQLPGGNIKANRDAIVAMNPTLQKDPNRVLSGHTYLLPAGQATAPKTVVVAKADDKADSKTADKTDAKKVDTKPADKTVVADAGQRVYVVKAGDTLSKIASNELGSKSEVDTIRKMNTDVLKGGDKIMVAMKLKLPVKAAMASIR